MKNQKTNLKFLLLFLLFCINPLFISIQNDSSIGNYYSDKTIEIRSVYEIKTSTTNFIDPKLSDIMDTNSKAVFYEDDLVYLADGMGGLKIIDVSNKSNPILIGDYDDGGDVRDVYVSGDYAYIADFQDGLEIVDISNPKKPVFISIFESIHAEGIFVQGGYAYIAADSSGIFILDISNPTNPVNLTQYKVSGSGYAKGIVVRDSLAYIAEGSEGLRIVNVSDPRNPVNINSIKYETGFSWNVDLNGDFAYLADGIGGLEIYNISDPFNPIFTDQYHDIDFYNDVAIVEKYAFIANGNRGLLTLDISNPYLISQVNRHRFFDPYSGQSKGIFTSGNYAYMADMNAGLGIINISNRNNPVRVGFFDEGGNVADVCTKGKYTYAVDFKDGLKIIDNSNPLNPLITGSYRDSLNYGSGIFVDDMYAYLADGSDGLEIIDITDKYNPIEVGSYENGSFYDLFIRDDLAYVASSTFGLKILNISNPHNPIEIGRYYNGSGIAYSVFVDGSYAFVADNSDGLEIINISNPKEPQLVSYYSGKGYTRGIFVNGTVAYVSDHFLGVEVLNISNIDNPTIINSFYQGGVQGYKVDVRYPYAFIAGRSGGLLILNITNPSDSLSLINQFDDNTGSAYGVSATKNLVFLADYADGIEIFEFNDQESPCISRIQHNPANPTNTDLINISALVTDNLGLESVELFYRLNNETWNAGNMILSSKSTYYFIIGPYDENSVIEYYIEAIDISSNKNKEVADNNEEFYIISILKSNRKISWSIFGLLFGSLAIISLIILFKKNRI
jgi:hypothetical protein